MSTVQQRNSLRFYQGSIQEYEKVTAEGHQKYTSSFYMQKGAYNILNMLLCPGMNSEYARIVQEKKKLPLMILQQTEEIIHIYEDIFTVMCEERKQRTVRQYVYRIDRMQTMEMLKAGYTFGFTSCSLNKESGIEDAQLRKKNGLLLLELEVPTEIPYILLNEVLGSNKYAYQNELLIPPFAAFRIIGELPFTKKELEYCDANREHPKAKYQLEIIGMDMGEGGQDQKNILEKEDINFAISVLTRIGTGLDISMEEKERYCEWKSKLQRGIRERFRKIYQERKGN